MKSRRSNQLGSALREAEKRGKSPAAGATRARRIPVVLVAAAGTVAVLAAGYALLPLDSQILPWSGSADDSAAIGSSGAPGFGNTAGGATGDAAWARGPSAGADSGLHAAGDRTASPDAGDGRSGLAGTGRVGTAVAGAGGGHTALDSSDGDDGAIVDEDALRGFADDLALAFSGVDRTGTTAAEDAASSDSPLARFGGTKRFGELSGKPGPMPETIPPDVEAPSDSQLIAANELPGKGGAATLFSSLSVDDSREFYRSSLVEAGYTLQTDRGQAGGGWEILAIGPDGQMIVSGTPAGKRTRNQVFFTAK